MRNGTMFADLLKYQKKPFWEAHQVIQVDNLYEHREYRVFSVFYAEEQNGVKREGCLLMLVWGA